MQSMLMKVLVVFCIFGAAAILVAAPDVHAAQVQEIRVVHEVQDGSEEWQLIEGLSDGYMMIGPRWSQTLLIIVFLDIQNGRAEMAGSVQGKRGTERISVNARLERVNPNGTTTRVGSWDNINVNGSLWAWSRIHHVARGHNYRLTLTSTVFRDGASETVSLSRTTFAH